MDGSFVDLRLNQRDSQGEDSFWPSFTDIMTVIVMIFLLAMVILLLRNMELLSQLRATMEAEQEAAELARTTGEEKATLEEKLIAREYELSMLRMELLRMEESAEQQEAAISSQRNQIASLSREKDRLNTQITRLSRESEQLNSQLTLANRNIERLTSDLEQSRQQQALTQADLQALQRSYRDQEAALAAALASEEETSQALAELKTDFSDLKIKYDKLVRPARTPKGKTVVEVRYAKVGGKYRIDYKGPGDSSFQRISRNSLDRKLTQLKKRHNNLYIKVILPKESGLSYSEAWSFTNHLHRNYDYYFQEEAQKERVIR
jgi:predicted  nucleic acid-binding Zn-ribbon protein